MSRSIFRFFFSFPVSSRPIHTERRTKRKAAVVARSPLSPFCDRRTDRPTDRQAEQAGAAVCLCVRVSCSPARSVARPPVAASSPFSAAAAGSKLAPHGRRTHARSSVDGNVELGNNARNHENDGDGNFSRYQITPKSNALRRVPARFFLSPQMLVNSLILAGLLPMRQCVFNVERSRSQSPCTAPSHARRSFEVFLRVFLCPSTVAAAQSLSLSVPLFLSCRSAPLLLLHTHRTAAANCRPTVLSVGK